MAVIQTLGLILPIALGFVAYDANINPSSSTRDFRAVKPDRSLPDQDRPTVAATATPIAVFDKGNGAYPSAELTLGQDGNFYSTTDEGGANNKGTVFKVTPSGKLTSLISFKGSNGANPVAPIILAKNGAFYGTTSQGGANNRGTVFKITSTGRLTQLASFKGSNGQNPRAGLLQTSDGTFYGTTSEGGSGSNCGPQKCGTVFKMTPSGRIETLVNFNGLNGARPKAGLTLGKDGNLYGTTAGLETLPANQARYGTLFKMTPSGTLSTLVRFNGRNGKTPTAPLILGKDGNFYGTTEKAAMVDSGTVFKVSPTGQLKTLKTFKDFEGGFAPTAPLIQGKDGNFYGTTTYGGRVCFSFINVVGCGTVFKLSPTGSFKTLIQFDYSDGEYPVAGLTLGKDGQFYGTTLAGGRGWGTVYRLNLP
ncbi:MAG: choice-of-anchor tandem repeat GloVer-containing protein [Thermosynechococcaceae cyanobacterium]